MATVKALKPLKVIRTATDESSAEVNEIAEDTSAPEIPEVEVATPVINQIKVEDVQPKNPTTVKISVFTKISPAPRIGTFSFQHSLGLSELVPGMYEVPYNVGLVLVDRKAAQFV